MKKKVLISIFGVAAVSTIVTKYFIDKHNKKIEKEMKEELNEMFSSQVEDSLKVVESEEFVDESKEIDKKSESEIE